MKPRTRVLLGLLVAAVLAEQAWLAQPLVRRLVFPPQTDSAAQGRLVAERLGCFSCHGAEGDRGIANPGSGDEVVPALAGGEMMMWAGSEEELREWVLHGRILAEEPEERSGLSAGQGTGRALVMPAFSEHITDHELDLLIAYLRAISGLQFPEDDTVRAGFELAHELGCFRCHGPMGVGGVANPGSLKGYIPGFFGEDYEELVTERSEARQWIANGVSDSFRDDVAASWIINGQAVKMPAYADLLTDDEIDSLVALVEWLDGGQWREMPVP